ncbi:GAF and ANTAR domain-containing protein [Modestobacter sp. VKM Ac-2986]|uniref:GAF and ANTAR domain-containing protein n=1 Tax=Modestobacter sp. VKM Ac-2986 TaxID=3004140 RepID=UPI0022ABAA22|nr:GAF and ANTAR domain-containing protein [Modestobacter sp. VKM Ac-2986]MCZ2830329.1 GAF and ANTAR domain-containing protein [Modestobacter sp. VKM Ac-2986]
MDTLLQAVVDTTTSSLPGHVQASLTVVVGSRPATAAYSGQLALDLDETQYEHGHGPCLHAARTGELMEITDARTDARWPAYMPRAVERGSHSSLALPVPVTGLHAALNIYSTADHVFDRSDHAAAARFARAAAHAVTNMHALQAARDVAGNLEVALQSRAVIDQAKGILMERGKLTAEQAFQALSQTSQLTNRKLRDVADHLVRTGELLRPAARR